MHKEVFRLTTVYGIDVFALAMNIFFEFCFWLNIVETKTNKKEKSRFS